MRSDRVTAVLLDALKAILVTDGDLAQILREQLIAMKSIVSGTLMDPAAADHRSALKLT